MSDPALRQLLEQINGASTEVDRLLLMMKGFNANVEEALKSAAETREMLNSLSPATDRGASRPTAPLAFEPEGRGSLPGVVAGLAGGTPPVGPGQAEDRLDPILPTILAEVVLRLRREWNAGPALLWGLIHPIDKHAVTDLEKRVALLLRNGFFEYSQLLCGLEMLALQLQKGGVLREESVLGCEQRLVQLRNLRSSPVEVPHVDGSGQPLPDQIQGSERHVD